jgi:hypothetical protein
MTAIKELPLVGLPLALVFHMACSGASPPPTGQDGSNQVAKGTATTSATGDAGKPTVAPPSAVHDAGATKDAAAAQPNLPVDGAGADCCFNGKYYRCPDAKACTGGTDLDCLNGCFPGDACWDDCFAKLRTGGGPVGCDENAAPPPNVDCRGQ